MTLILTGGTIYGETGVRTGDLLIADGQVQAIGPGLKVPKGAQRIDCSGRSVLPGFVDIHAHGADGIDVMEGADAVRQVARFKARHGTTAFLPTTTSAPVENILSAAEGIVEAQRQQQSETGLAEARVLGAHIEGPFLNPDFAGAQPEQYLRPPGEDLVDRLAAILGSLFRMMTLAPELPGGEEVVRQLARIGVRPSAGHSGATAADLSKAVAAGLGSVTHVFNAMRGFHHREPGIPGGAISHERLLCELICDLVHIHAEVLQLFISAKTPGQCVLVTDAIAAAGMPDGEYALGADRVTVTAGVCRTKSGALAGSTLTMAQGFRNLVQGVGLPVEEVVLMAATNPAQAAGMGDRKGSLAEGNDGDVVILDADLKVVHTVVGGSVTSP